MKTFHAGLVLILVAAGLLASAQLSLRAQVGEAGAERGSRGPRAGGVDPPAAAVSVQDALQRPFSFPFGAPTALSDVCQYLRHELKAPVVLDLAALDRHEIHPEDRVQLELEGVRLKTGLKLLLDQVGLTYSVVAEDNLLIVTDHEGSGETVDRVLSEVKALHRDVHDLQDAVDDVVWSLGLEGGAKVRKPTIIEEMPEPTEVKPEEKAQAPVPGTTERRRTRPGA